MKFPRRITSLALVAVSQFGCSLDSSPTESRTHSPRVIQDAFDPEPTAAGPTLDELFLEVGKDVPGFAGLVIDSVGVLELKLVDTTDAPRAREAISRVFGESYVGNRATRAGAARYSFSQMHSWREALYSRGLPAGIRLVDLDEQRNVIYIGTADAAVAQSVMQMAKAAGIPGNAVVAEPAPAFTPLTDYLTSPIRPVMGGLTIVTTAHGCTLGFKALKTGNRYVVTNAHCTSTFASVNGDGLGQPLLQSNYFIGYETDDPAFTATGCVTGYTCRWADAAMFWS